MCFPLASCCCCISLEVGAQIISIVSTMLSALVMLVYGAAAALPALPRARTLFYAAMAATACCQLVFGGLLTYGTFKKKPRLMWPWLALTWSLGAALVAASVAGTALLAYAGSLQAAGEINCVISVYMVYSVVLLYFACVVNSRRLEILREEASSESAKSLVRAPAPGAWKYA